MPIGDQDQGGIALALGIGLAALPRGLEELLDLVGCQVFALAQVGIDRAERHCPVLCVGATSLSLAFASILLPPLQFIYPIMNIYRSIDQRIRRNFDSFSGPVLNLYCAPACWSAD